MTESSFPSETSDKLIDALIRRSVVGPGACTVNILAVRGLPLRVFAHGQASPGTSHAAAEAIAGETTAEEPLPMSGYCHQCGGTRQLVRDRTMLRLAQLGAAIVAAGGAATTILTGGNVGLWLCCGVAICGLLLAGIFAARCQVRCGTCGSRVIE